MGDQRSAFERQKQLIAAQSRGHPGSRHNRGKHLEEGVAEEGVKGVAGVQELQNREGYRLKVLDVYITFYGYVIPSVVFGKPDETGKDFQGLEPLLEEVSKLLVGLRQGDRVQ